MDLLTLIGDAEENFYQLGLADRLRAKDVHRDVKLMLSTPWPMLNTTIGEVAKVVLKNSLLKKTDYYRHLKSYSEGLGIPLEEAAYVMLIPEIVSCMSKWAPGFIKGNLGCSSFFMKNSDQQVVHGRILDFPLQGSYDLNERAVFYDLNGYPKMMGFGAAGIPYPSITLMTEDGMTLALHQKFSNVFNKDGMSIFELIFDLTKNANDKKSVLEYLQSHGSITTWCLYMSFKNGDVLAVDIMGREIFSNEHQVPDKGILYFCNHLENKKLIQEEFIPTGFHQYNVMREKIAHKKIEHFIAKKAQNETELIKMMSTPYSQPIKNKGQYSDYLMDTLTPSSLTVMTLNPTDASALYLDQPAPKLFRDNIIKISNAFSDPSQMDEKNKKHKVVSEDYYQGLIALMKAQKGFDLRDPQAIYHHLQFAVDHLENHLEKCLPEFYFLVAQYLFETHPKVLSTLLHDFKKLEGHLPQSLNDHCLLFIGRLQRILKIAPSVEEDKIIHTKLKNVFALEMKVPQAILHATTKNMMVPRIDILDIIYLYTS